jgi:hypothetical protein
MANSSRAPSAVKPDTNGKPKPPTPRPPAVVQCAVWINGVAYEVSLLAPEPGTGIKKAYRLKNAENGNEYDLAWSNHGIECECGDFEFRRAGKDPEGCKHIDALRQLGMMPDLRPTPPRRAAGDRGRPNPEAMDRIAGGLIDIDLGASGGQP